MKEHPMSEYRRDMSTEDLRAIIERPRVEVLWGNREQITPLLVPGIIGDGNRLIALTPVMQRPNFFVVRVGSDCSLSNFEDNETLRLPSDWLDDVWDAVDEEYRLRDSGCQEEECVHHEDYPRDGECWNCTEWEWPHVDSSDGCSWGEVTLGPEWESGVAKLAGGAA